MPPCAKGGMAIFLFAMSFKSCIRKVANVAANLFFRSVVLSSQAVSSGMDDDKILFAEISGLWVSMNGDHSLKSSWDEDVSGV